MSEDSIGYGDACIKLAELIESGYFEYPEAAGLAIQLFCSAYEENEDPAMCLALAKHPEVNGRAGVTD